MGDEGGKLFVGSLAWGTTDESLHNAFSGFGEVVEARARAFPVPLRQWHPVPCAWGPCFARGHAAGLPEGENLKTPSGAPRGPARRGQGALREAAARV